MARASHATEPGPGRRTRSRLVAVFVLVVAVCSAAPVASVAEPDLRLTGTFPRPDGGLGIRANGEMLMRPSARRAYQAVTSIGTAVTEFDLDTLAERRTVTLPEFQPAFTTSGETQFLWALDEVNGRIFAVVRGNDARGQRNYSIVTLDLRTMSFERSEPLWPLPDRFPLAIGYHAPSDRIYLLLKLNVDAFGREIPLLEERGADGPLGWIHPLPMCSAARDHLLAPIVARSVLAPDTVYLDCYSRNTVQAQVVRVRLGADGRPAAEDVFPAVPKAVSALFDPGSDRIIFLTSNGNAGRGAWVFDGRRGSFLGVIASGDARAGANDYAMGLDPRSGRLYVQSPAGLIVSDARNTPLGAGLLFPEYAGPGYVPIHVDSERRRVFAPDPTTATLTGQPKRFRVLLDTAPRAIGVRALGPDVLTAGVEEKPGITAANYSGAASAFAARALTTGGVQRAAWNAAIPNIDPEDLEQAWDALGAVPVSTGDRDLVAARVIGVTLNNDAADARASGATASDANLRDLEARGIAWPYEQAECHGTSGARAADTKDGAAVVCDARATRPETTAETVVERFSVPLGSSSIDADVLMTSVIVERTRERGAVARSLSIVRNLSLLGRIRIGELRARAETWAHGRKGTAGSRYERSLLDVWIDTDGDGDGDYTCDVCDPRAVLPEINRALGGTAVVRMPEPDGTFYPDGSPGGYQAVVRRDIFESLAASALNSDDAAEIPGLEIVAYADGRAGRSRQVLQFAAVEAESRYGIYLLPSDEVLAPPTRRPPRKPVPVIERRTDPVPVVVPPVTRDVVSEVVRRIKEGWRLALSSPREALLLAALWAFLAAPFGVVARRRKLERVDG